MEIFLLYNSFVMALSMFGISFAESHFWGLLIGFVLWLGLFILQGFGLWKMASKKGLEKKWLVFVPFVNYLYMGKLAGDCQFFSQKVKKMGLFVMIAQIIATIFSLLLLASVSYLCLVEGQPFLDEYGMPDWSGSGFSKTVENFYNVGAGYNPFGISILSILQLVYEIMLLVLTIGLYKRYAPKNYMLLSILGVFLPMSRYVVIFCLRNKQEIDYEAYVRARREAMAREYQQRYGGGYGTPYGGSPYGTPYGSPYNQPNEQPQQPEEPFGEFDKGEKAEQPFGEFGDEKTAEKPSEYDDGFFNN